MRRFERPLVLISFFLLLALPQLLPAQAVPVSAAQHEHGEAPPQRGSANGDSAEPVQMENMSAEEINAPAAAPGMLLQRQASGTSLDPQSVPHDMIMLKAHRWDLMFHGVLFVADTEQSGPRGADKFFSASWFMGAAQHHVGKGALAFRAMLSLDPATISHRRYPELFQTGETAFGVPIVDAQHPHDFVMEAAFEYAHPLTENTALIFYAAAVGDPALGPVAFPHRESAAEIPQAPLSHHLQDSSHIANEVFTAGVKHKFWGIEASGFHGAEPDENRWNIDAGTPDSWAARIALTPSANWAAQVSLGRLHRPEAAEPGDIVRATASLDYNKPFARGNWAASFIWGRNHKTAEARTINSYLLESSLQFHDKNFVAARFELVDKDELFRNQPNLERQLASTAGSVFRIGAYTVGYTRDFKLIPRLQTGLGANITLYSLPSAIKPYYGEHPIGVMLFLRLKLKPAAAMHHMNMP